MDASLGLPPAVSALVEQVIQDVRAAFPARVLACYLCGSYATGTATTSSDVDIAVVFVDRFSPEERRRLADIATVVAGRGTIRVDLAAVAERFVCTTALPSMRVARLIWGTDLADRIRIEPVEVTGRRMTRAAFHYLWLVRDKAPGLVAPLDYPVPEAEFFGYEVLGVLRPDHTWTTGTRQLAATATVMASSRLALDHGIQATGKAHSAALAREHLAEFGVFVHDLYRTASGQWHGGMPGTATDRARLRAWCATMLGHENQFLADSRPWLACWSTDSDPASRTVAQACLSRIGLPGR